MIKELIKIANELDSRGLVREADSLDRLVKVALIIDMPMWGMAERAYRSAYTLGGDVRALRALNAYLSTVPGNVMTEPLKAAYRAAIKATVVDGAGPLAAKQLARQAFLSAGGSTTSSVLTGVAESAATAGRAASRAGAGRAAAGRVLSRVAVPAALVMGTVDLGRLLYHGWAGFRGTDLAHANANISMAKSRVERAWGNSIRARGGYGESRETQPFLSDSNVMRAWRDDPSSVSAAAIGGPLARISSEDWSGARLEVEGSYGSVSEAEVALRRMVRDIPQNARPASQIRDEIAGYLAGAQGAV